MKRYRDNGLLIIANIVLEYALMIAAYFFCALIRLNIHEPYAREYHTSTMMKYFPSILLLGLVMVIAYYVLGDYETLHYRSVYRMAARVAMVSFLTGMMDAAIMFMIDGYPFSRVMMVMLIICWTVFIALKRYIMVTVANKAMSDKISTYNVLILGSRDNAERYYLRLKKDTSSRTHYIGYLADEVNDHMPDYLGRADKLQDVLENHTVHKVVIAEEQPDRKYISDVLSACAVYGIEAFIIPVFAEYMSEGARVKCDDGLNGLILNAYNTSDILGVRVSVTDMDKTILDITRNLENWRGKYICVSNVHTTVMAHDDPEYLKVQNGAVMALPDGGPLSSYSRAEGRAEAERVTGPDLMRQMLIKSRETGWRHFFYGSTQKTLDMLKEKIEKEYPGAVVAGMISPPYREITPEEDIEFVNTINEAKPDFVWVGLGAPKQEIWMAAHENRVNALMIGVGAAFDYESGNLKRAPKWMQKGNLEWLYRFMQEPRRLFKRYFVTNIKFLWLTRR